jgi:hypothetical protein
MSDVCRAALLVAAAMLIACGGDEAPTEHVATEADFVGFDTWERFDRGHRGFLPSHPDGATYVYRNRPPPPGATHHPVGTIVVRVTMAGPESDWEVHAMVRRGGGFNAAGAAGWEYFDLRLEHTGEQLTPRIRWRGEGPGDSEDGYAHGAEGIALGCNHCHAAVARHDGLIGDELALPAP